MVRILHLEDQPDDAFFIQRALKVNGVEAKTTLVKNQEEFTSALERGEIDLILVDNAIPGFSGVEAVAVAHRACPGVSVICVSGAPTEEQVMTALKAGAAGFVRKDQLWQLCTAVRSEMEKLRLTKLNRGRACLVAAVQELSLARDLSGIMSVVRKAARELTGADGATFVLKDGETCFYAEEYAIAPLWKGQRFPLSSCISGWAMLNRQPAIIEDIYADPRVPAEAYRPTFVKSLAMVPIRTEAPIGAIGNYWAQRHQPTAEEVELLQALANTTAVAMENVQVYGELEQRVKTRTAELEAANQELEAFSYAVSHDLGAPLRSITGYSSMLLTESEATLDENAKGRLGKIRAAANRMGRLIDDLMRLSKLSKGSLHFEKVDLSEMAKEIAAQLSGQAPERKVEVQIFEGMETSGDAGLLHAALENLLGNAWKYTSKCAHPRIEFGSSLQPGGATIFHVRDNGAGFDMRYSQKLFQPFQRLHSDAEFAGSGVGLATVQRIIRRHNGKIWAEATPGQGATFYFTLGPD